MNIKPKRAITSSLVMMSRLRNRVTIFQRMHVWFFARWIVLSSLTVHAVCAGHKSNSREV